ncbi:conserved hypothetical protein [Beutenbergia cavernae DSM 12333]|uniref:Uncharacterized protein n=1 Tax=Beutenbergia cavernae (strain ATCC BAA-8 / DSM 12333 / CCUG 43141 / JCM 11478 / NBRC 16432 / NCIMB 13614 / HKI 0122) TaxID=471853 RepID=C5C5Z7_BEUC1|nr:hypothetical protein [Beutenbergia cavernae]ACQ82355.1 conserved hypothetical protein [Beutenbergia cavernae DSM 12333]
MPQDWIEHRRAGDRELLGWMRLDGDGFVAIDRLGREITGVVPWDEAEDALDERGLHWLADLWQLERPGSAPLRVRIVEVGPDRVVVKRDDFGDVGAKQETYELPFPAPGALQPFDGDPHVILAADLPGSS